MFDEEPDGDLHGECAAEIGSLRLQKDGAYTERNKCVAFIARTAVELGYRAGIAKTAIEGWSEDWHGCVYIDLPTGQVSWHYHDSQAWLFERLPPYSGTWDGHDTPEKYQRLLACVGIHTPSNGEG
jgi:hypothetical protein